MAHARPGLVSEVTASRSSVRATMRADVMASSLRSARANSGLSVGQCLEHAYLNSVPYLRPIALICSRVNSFRGSPGRLQFREGNRRRPGAPIHSKTSS